MKLNQIINLHKGLTPFVVVGLMTIYDNFSTPAWIYLALHGTYGLLWLLKEKLFPDPYFKDEMGIITSIIGFIFLGSYWVAPFLLISSKKLVPDFIIAGCISIYIIGVFLHFVSDSQKYFTLKLKKDLITEGFFKKSRNTNYLGEILIYLSFAILSMDIIPFIILLIFFIIVFLPRMIKKDKSLAKYEGFVDYKNNSGLLFPKLNEK
tara:strand:+ start:1562 stop:2182 length:621 start_codon:yes stop_codon:yes gene_type:complete